MSAWRKWQWWVFGEDPDHPVPGARRRLAYGYYKDSLAGLIIVTAVLVAIRAWWLAAIFVVLSAGVLLLTIRARRRWQASRHAER